MPPAREERRHSARRAEGKKEQRDEFQRDRDRLLYCSALRRLGEVTQVVAPNEGHVFHNRLTHTLKVAQLGRRIAEKLAGEQPDIAAAHGGLEPEVVEAACLAHDLGHPPFGHIAEEELDRELRHAGVAEGFEGNAQSFRIITKLVAHRTRYLGLDLTRATLGACLKYPWRRKCVARGQTPTEKKSRKWGAYDTEDDDFRWARAGRTGDARSVEAEVMDWADDIAYAVHDLEDFYRAGLVPLDRLARRSEERTAFIEWLRQEWEQKKKIPFEGALPDILENLLPMLSVEGPYGGRYSERAALREMTSFLIARYVFAIRLQEPTPQGRSVTVPEVFRHEVTLLQQLTRRYVIESPALATQQYGKARIIRELVAVFQQIIGDGDRRWLTVLPEPVREQAIADGRGADASTVLRLVADAISSLTDREALASHQRLHGARVGSLHDPWPLH